MYISMHTYMYLHNTPTALVYIALSFTYRLVLYTNIYMYTESVLQVIEVWVEVCGMDMCFQLFPISQYSQWIFLEVAFALMGCHIHFKGIPSKRFTLASKSQSSQCWHNTYVYSYVYT